MLGSPASTTCSSPTNNSVDKVIKNDTVRYIRKGYGLVTAVSLALFYLFAFPKLLKPLWAWLLEANPDLGMKFIFFTNLFGHTLLGAIANITFMCIYKLRLPFFERYKVTEKPWPWDADPVRWKKMLKLTFKSLFVFHFITFPIFLYVDIYVLKTVDLRLDVESFPESKEIISQIIFFMIMEDVLFYWSHRMLHHPKIYRFIHKRHHEYIDPISIAAEYAHPIENVLANMIPTSIGMHLLGHRVHYVTWMMWLLIRVFETADGHSGYEFSWSPFRLLPLSGSAKYHDFHHTHNTGNYGSFFTYWDTIMSTNGDYFRYLAKKEYAQSLGKKTPPNCAKADVLPSETVKAKEE
jgi:sterol desaturase/sphingolipid hydroxylase (fatty acid hydroxylase superfamily)